MDALPSPTASDGRDGRGRFAPGNTAARGNPHAAQVSRLRATLLAAITEDDMRQVARVLVEKAKQGDLPAIRELLLRTLGRPLEGDLLDRIERLESALGVTVDAAS
jgi:hypothetical protein